MVASHDVARKALASMRPGHFCPGNDAAAAGKDAQRPGFNEAGAFLPRKPGRRRRRRTAEIPLQ